MKSVYSIDCVWYVQSLVGEGNIAAQSYGLPSPSHAFALSLTCSLCLFRRVAEHVPMDALWHS